MNPFGIMMEYRHQYTKRTDWTAFSYGCVAGIVAWIVITLPFVGAVASCVGEVAAMAAAPFGHEVVGHRTSSASGS